MRLPWAAGWYTDKEIHFFTTNQSFTFIPAYTHGDLFLYHLLPDKDFCILKKVIPETCIYEFPETPLNKPASKVTAFFTTASLSTGS
jgi:hypothetical protein